MSSWQSQYYKYFYSLRSVSKRDHPACWMPRRVCSTRAASDSLLNITELREGKRVTYIEDKAQTRCTRSERSNLSDVCHNVIKRDTYKTAVP